MFVSNDSGGSPTISRPSKGNTVSNPVGLLYIVHTYAVDYDSKDNTEGRTILKTSSTQFVRRGDSSTGTETQGVPTEKDHAVSSSGLFAEAASVDEGHLSTQDHVNSSLPDECVPGGVVAGPQRKELDLHNVARGIEKDFSPKDPNQPPAQITDHRPRETDHSVARPSRKRRQDPSSSITGPTNKRPQVQPAALSYYYYRSSHK